MKAHIGVDANSGAVRSATVALANTADITELPKLLRKGGQAVFGDAGHTSDDHKKGSRHLSLGWCVNGKGLSSKQRKRNREQSQVRARVEHTFRIIKRQFGFRNARYRGLTKDASQVNLPGLANLYLPRRPTDSRLGGIRAHSGRKKPQAKPETALKSGGFLKNRETNPASR